jgi:hypothetical protein
MGNKSPNAHDCSLGVKGLALLAHLFANAFHLEASIFLADCVGLHNGKIEFIGTARLAAKSDLRIFRIT